MVKYFRLFLFLVVVPLSAAQTMPSKGFVIFSPPKCGTFLISETVALIVNQEPAYHLTELGTQVDAFETVLNETNRFVVAHNFSPTVLKMLVHNGYKIIFLQRDPRDQLISVLNWMGEGQWSWMPISTMQNFDAQITEAITGEITRWQCFERCFLRYEGYIYSLSPKSVYRATFENLVGPDGGGSKQAQIDEIMNIAKFLGVSITKERALQISNQIYGKEGTFRTGMIGNWKNYFSNHQKALFKSLYNIHLIRLGYESDDQW